MKRKTLTSLCFLIIALSLGLCSGLAFALVGGMDLEEQKEARTLVIINHLEKLRVNCHFGVEKFESMQAALVENPPSLINPMPKNEALLSARCKPYWDALETIVKKAKHVDIDHEQILEAVQQLTDDIKDDEYKREEARVDTQNINLEMEFVAIPKGRYENKFAEYSKTSDAVLIKVQPEVEVISIGLYEEAEETVDTFEISQDIAIQTTPVTQYQWAKIMGDNPSNFKTGEDSRMVDVDGKQIEMCPNKPVENISYAQIVKSIEKLNEQDDEYEYQLPSIEEYLAVIGKNMQTRGTSCLNAKETCHVGFSGYQYLGDKRIYSILYNVQEFTRDFQGRSDLPSTNKILFGFAHDSTDTKVDSLASITRPIYYEDTSNKDIGFRLIRYRKGAATESISKAGLQGKSYSLIWGDKGLSSDKNYVWDEFCNVYVHKSENFDWMVGHKYEYSEAIQHTINELLKKGSVEDLKNMFVLNLSDRNITDVSPLAGLTNLGWLYLHQNRISDISSLAGLTNLDMLYLDQNRISDISSLAGLTNLEILYLSQNQISDYSLLKNLEINGCKITK
jgi:formylglycine-generating enzyme required for sulfatase activity